MRCESGAGQHYQVLPLSQVSCWWWEQEIIGGLNTGGREMVGADDFGGLFKLYDSMKWEGIDEAMSGTKRG